jgi:hypothetical protein
MSDETEVTGKAKGGVARAAKLSPDERSAIASEAARQRWEQREIRPNVPTVLAGYKSEINLGGMKLPCAVIQGRFQTTEETRL